MRFDIMTLFPETVAAVLDSSIIGRAKKKGAIDINFHNIRDYTLNKQRQCDDYPFGGGSGLIMNCQPILHCYRAIAGDIFKSGNEITPHVIYMSPKGSVFTQKKAAELAKKPCVIILCGHYEGVDQRVLDEIVDEDISIGDYVLTGGEIAACAIVDAVGRLLPGVLSADECFEKESHYNGLLEYPQYTRPASYNGQDVPEILLNGHHAKIEQWRHEKSLETTLQHRPDMLLKYNLTKEDIAFLVKLIQQSPDAASHLKARQKKSLYNKLKINTD